MKRQLAIFVILIGAIIPYCAHATNKDLWFLQKSAGEAPILISFSHQYHLKEVGATCKDCHPNYKKPTMEICSQCHEGTGPNMPAIECMKCHLRLDFGGVSKQPLF